MWPNQQLHSNLITFPEEILNGKLRFLSRSRSFPEEFVPTNPILWYYLKLVFRHDINVTQILSLFLSLSFAIFFLIGLILQKIWKLRAPYDDILGVGDYFQEKSVCFDMHFSDLTNDCIICIIWIVHDIHRALLCFFDVNRSPPDP